MTFTLFYFATKSLNSKFAFSLFTPPISVLKLTSLAPHCI